MAKQEGAYAEREPEHAGLADAIALPHGPRPRPRLRSRAGPRGHRVWLVLAVLWDALLPLVLLALVSRAATIGFPAEGGSSVWLTGLVMAGVAPLAMRSIGAYASHVHMWHDRTNALGGFFLVSALLAWIAWIVDAAAGMHQSLGQLALVSLLLPFGWLGGRWLLQRLRRRLPDRVVIVGGGDATRRLGELSRIYWGEAVEIIGCLDDDQSRTEDLGLPSLGGIDDLQQILTSGDVDRVILGFSSRDDAQTMRLLRSCEAHDVNVDVLPRFVELMGPASKTYALGGMSLITVGGGPLRVSDLVAKRALDLTGSVLLLLLLSPFMVGISLAILLDNGRPVFFRHARLGRGERPFKALKFRTMVPSAAEAVTTGTFPLKDADDPRITRVGRFLRATSLDELPQLFNVLIGQMSLVGPRPLVAAEVEALEPWQHARHTMRPGMTGLWQVLGRSDVTWEERMLLDYSYVRHYSIGLDLKILLRTGPAVASRRGAI